MLAACADCLILFMLMLLLLLLLCLGEPRRRRDERTRALHRETQRHVQCKCIITRRVSSLQQLCSVRITSQTHAVVVSLTSQRHEQLIDINDRATRRTISSRFCGTCDYSNRWRLTRVHADWITLYRDDSLMYCAPFTCIVRVCASLDEA